MLSVTQPISEVPTAMGKEIHTEIDINASTQKVWEVLTTFESYKTWNPFIIQISGELKEGAQLETHMKLGDEIQTFKPTVMVVEDGKAFEWLGSVPLGAFKGRHCFRLESLGPDKCRLYHYEQFSGWLSGPILKRIGQETLACFEQMNIALKNRVEG